MLGRQYIIKHALRRSIRQRHFSALPTAGLYAAAPLAFIAQGFVRDDPEKHHQGEDALFIARRGLGVADGVGGWSRQGIDSGEYSRSLMQHAFEYTQQHQDDLEVDPYEALEYAYKRTNVPGSTTAVIACGGRGNVKAINLGDSGIVHFRQGDDGEYKIGAVSDEQTLGFNMPRQLGTGSNDTPTIGQRLSFSSKPGDLVLLASDGLFDNVFIEDMRKILSTFHFKKCKEFSEKSLKESDSNYTIKESEELKQLESECRKELSAALQALKSHTEKIAASETETTPFQVGASVHGYQFNGGKEDDITIVLATVVPDSSNIDRSQDGFTEKRQK